MKEPAAPTALVLASSSEARARLLRAAGLDFAVEPARIDEEEVKRALLGEGAAPVEIAETLAELKATTVSRRRPAALVVGVDQVLSCEGRLFDKPADLEVAGRQLEALQGRRHELPTAAVAVRDGVRLWHCREIPRLVMRPLGPAFIEAYLARVGDAVLGSVGAYHVEGLGIQLFQRIEGDLFAIQGLPLLPLLAFLREHGLVPA